MTITKQMIEERLEVLKQDLQILNQKIIAVQGALMDCEYWLQELEKVDGEVNVNGSD